ncbi:MAG: hypothetical protein ACOCZU_03060 [Planctomycetota bacterium]
MPDLADALDTLKTLATPAELRELAEAGRESAGGMRINAHIHLPPNFSAFESVAQAVDLAKQQDVTVLGVSNYYDFTVYAEFIERCRAAGIFPLMGLEIICMDDQLRETGVKINDPGNPGKIYLCGKGITRLDPMTDRASELIETIRSNDDARMAEMIDKLDRHFASTGLELNLDADAVAERIVARHDVPAETVTLQERHVAQAFQEALFDRTDAETRIETLGRILGAPSKATPDAAVTIQGEIRSHLMKAGKPCFVAESFVSFAEAKELILELGGIPCYPTLADGTTPICAFEQPVGELIRNLRRRGIHCAEFIPTRNQPAVLQQYVSAMRDAGIAITGGTEHNTLELGPIDPPCAGGCHVPEPVREILREGAELVAAHQMLSLHGEDGYVTDNGEPNPAWETAEQRIADLSALGAAALGRYHTFTG